ncbi:hypothetical protein [Streptomyces sp. NPDC006463]|uniref:hypothetical protein n=1 Tax=Streptomyces sp. NPDC006463 TaxID=3364746 RepID=UPI0036CF7E28
MISTKSFHNAPNRDREHAISRDAALVEQLREVNFSGHLYGDFQRKLMAHTWPQLLGMARSGKLASACTSQFAAMGREFYVEAEHQAILHGNSAVREEICLDVLMGALKPFRENGLRGGGWDPEHKDALSLTSYFIRQCIWKFADVYRERRREWNRLVYDIIALDEEMLYRVLVNTMPEPDAIVHSSDIMRVLKTRSKTEQTIAVLTAMGDTDSQIVERLNSSLGAVRNARYRLRKAMRAAARNGEIEVPRAWLAPKPARRGKETAA